MPMPPMKRCRTWDIISWSEGMVWCSPERHGAMTGIMKAQIDWIPGIGSVRPTRGKLWPWCKCLRVHKPNTVNQLRILGRWMRCLTIPISLLCQSLQQFDDEGECFPPLFTIELWMWWRNCLSSLIWHATALTISLIATARGWKLQNNKAFGSKATTLSKKGHPKMTLFNLIFYF